MVQAAGELGGYVIDREAGRGGHATVYQAHTAARPDQRIALKVLRADHRSPADLSRLDREFQFAHRLGHPHIVTVYERGPYWLAMQFVDGGKSTLLQSQPDRLAALAQIADALDYMHRHGIVHADVKPANILVAKDFSRLGAYLIDFGVARAVADDVFRRPKDLQASLPYTAPEVLRGRAPSAATDEYALACSAFELLTGSTPFQTGTSTELVNAHLYGLPPRISPTVPWASRAFDTAVARAMAKDPEGRYRSCAKFVEHLTRAVR
jgi:serine/threonine protein kinase